MRTRDSGRRGQETKKDHRKRLRLMKRGRKELKTDGARKTMAVEVLDRVEPILANQSGPVALADFVELHRKMKTERLEGVEVHVSHVVVPALEEMRRRDADLEAFRKKHQIDREPDLDINRKAVAYWLASAFLGDTVVLGSQLESSGLSRRKHLWASGDAGSQSLARSSPHRDGLATINVSRRAPISDSRTQPPKE